MEQPDFKLLRPCLLGEVEYANDATILIALSSCESRSVTLANKVCDSPISAPAFNTFCGFIHSDLHPEHVRQAVGDSHSALPSLGALEADLPGT